MGKALVIVESPSKASIINRYLGNDYIVKASVGHVRDLPVSAADVVKDKSEGKKTKQSALAQRMGIDPEHGWKANYVIMPGKEKVVSELRKLSKDADQVYLATDLDREGEAIAWHLKEVLGGDESKYLRVKYPEITQSAIKKAFENPGQINMDLVNAQQTRRFLDRVVGFMVSPLLWKKVSRGLSAGRVQSVAVELIVDREREIKAFVPEEYWSIDALVQGSGGELKLELALRDGHKIKIGNAAQAQAVVNELKSLPFTVQSIESKQGQTHAKPPFTTSTLQQAANQILGFSVRRTMNVAQGLYERGYITYMRTDSVNLSQEAIAKARELIGTQYGAEFVPPKPNYYQDSANAQEAHEAIRPSHPEAALPSDVERDGQKLYALIMARYLASQMPPQRYESTTVSVSAGPYTLKASGRHILFEGFRKVWNYGRAEEVLLPELHEGESLTLRELSPLQHFTQPPARFSEATLVRELEKDGIGRPSTYAAIISTIQERGYVRLEHARFYAEVMGEVVTDRLRFSFKDLMNTGYTAQMEKELDEIAQGNKNWRDSLDQFYRDFSSELELASRKAADGGMPENSALEINLLCPLCRRHNMAVRAGKTGLFLSCLGYSDLSVPAEERCRKTLNLKALDHSALKQNQALSEEEEAAILRTRQRCPKCGSVMDAYLIDEHHKLHLCGNTGCGGYQLEEGDFSAQIDRGPEVYCDKCGSRMELKEGRFGKYMACTNSGCGNTRKILKNGQVAPPREDPVDLPELPCSVAGAHFMLRDGATGVFLAAHNFPKVRETRPPKVSELYRFQDRLPEKFRYLAQAPQTDPEGNETVVRFSRKLQQQYVAAVKDGKPTGFNAFYNEEKGQWEVAEGKSAAATTRSSKTAAKSKGTTRRTARKKSPS
ncbi:MAG: type I DNA topoisomerase [Succinivibrio sp.]|nr:type I DNA topoisomerase [Succinivibrio sp.]